MNSFLCVCVCMCGATLVPSSVKTAFIQLLLGECLLKPLLWLLWLAHIKSHDELIESGKLTFTMILISTFSSHIRNDYNIWYSLKTPQDPYSKPAVPIKYIVLYFSGWVVYVLFVRLLEAVTVETDLICAISHQQGDRGAPGPRGPPVSEILHKHS